jgi:hypothetical protein
LRQSDQQACELNGFLEQLEERMLPNVSGWVGTQRLQCRRHLARMAAVVAAGLTFAAASSANAEGAKSMIIISGKGTTASSFSNQTAGSCTPGRLIAATAQISGGSTNNRISVTASCGSTSVTAAAIDPGSPAAPSADHAFATGAASSPQAFASCTRTYTPNPQPAGTAKSEWVAICIFY